jgi:hypothetical protein
VLTRMASYRTNCPLPRVLMLAAEMTCRADALTLEQHLLGHLASDRLHGEWVRVRGVEAVVESLARVASEVCGRPIEFIGG